MAWIFVCDRCMKPSIDEGILRQNGEHAGTLIIDQSMKTRPTRDNPELPERYSIELCHECWNNHVHWTGGLDVPEPRLSSLSLTTP